MSISVYLYLYIHTYAYVAYTSHNACVCAQTHTHIHRVNTYHVQCFIFFKAVQYLLRYQHIDLLIITECKLWFSFSLYVKIILSTDDVMLM